MVALTKRELWVTNACLTIAVVFALAPVVGIVLVALQVTSPGGGITSLTNLTLHNFSTAWAQGYMSDSLRSSAIIVAISVPTATLCCTLAGYAFGTMRWPGRGPLLGLFVFALMIPIEGTLIPIYFIWRDVGIVDTYWAVILTEVGYSMPFGVFWLSQAFRGVPRELLEAARIDRASTWQTFRLVAGPMCMPAITTLAALQFMWVWNDFLMPLVTDCHSEPELLPGGICRQLHCFGGRECHCGASRGNGLHFSATQIHRWICVGRGQGVTENLGQNVSKCIGLGGKMTKETMRAAILRAPGNMVVEEVPLPEPPPGWVRIKVRASGICGSDIHIFTGQHPWLAPGSPMENLVLGQVYGHEVAGTIDALGDGSTLQVGTRVAPYT